MDQYLSLIPTGSQFPSGIVVDIIQRVLDQPQLYSFGEIRSALMRGVLLDDETTHSAKEWLCILDIFTFGEWNDYIRIKEANGYIPQLSTLQMRKLRHLSLVSIASRNRHLSYSDIANELDIEEQSLEGFLVESLYDGLITGRLDTKRQVLEVTSTIGRDVNDTALASLELDLTKWVDRTQQILDEIQLHSSNYKHGCDVRKVEITEYQGSVAKANVEFSRRLGTRDGPKDYTHLDQRNATEVL